MTRARFLVALPILAFLIGSASAQDKPVSEKAAPAWPKGELLKFEFSDSHIFPGTVREYSVYIPAQYDGTKDACLYVCQDGILYNTPAVFDELIHKGEMPVTIGVFVKPGIVPSEIEGGLGRYNRSYEYDSVTPNYADFLKNDLLPDVSKHLTTKGYPIRLSSRSTDRAIAGNSSGGVCAWTVAWFRPDEFSRVFTGVGTYVGLRGADEYPTLVRKTEPKPIRVFLADNAEDLNIYAGDWWMANNMMLRALEFAGYEVSHAFSETGGHNQKQATEVFPEAMRFLWKDWPEAPKAGKGSPDMQALLLEGEDWELVLDSKKGIQDLYVRPNGTLETVEGNLMDFFGMVFEPNHPREVDPADFSRIIISTTGDISRQALLEDGEVAVHRSLTSDGFEFYVDQVTEQVWRRDVKSNARMPVAEEIKQEMIADILGISAEQCLVLSYQPGQQFGRLKLRNYRLRYGNFELSKEDSMMGSGGKMCLSPDRSMFFSIADNVRFPRAAMLTANQQFSYLTKWGYLHTQLNREVVGGFDIAMDTAGCLLIATAEGVQYLDPLGRVRCILSKPGCSHLVLAGEKFDTLYCVQEFWTKLYRRRLNITGVAPGQAQIKQAKPKL